MEAAVRWAGKLLASLVVIAVFVEAVFNWPLHWTRWHLDINWGRVVRNVLLDVSLIGVGIVLALGVVAYILRHRPTNPHGVWVMLLVFGYGVVVGTVAFRLFSIPTLVPEPVTLLYLGGILLATVGAAGTFYRVARRLRAYGMTEAWPKGKEHT